MNDTRVMLRKAERMRSVWVAISTQIVFFRLHSLVLFVHAGLRTATTRQRQIIPISALAEAPRGESKTVPLALHGDGTPVSGIGKAWSRLMDIYSFTSLMAAGATLFFYVHDICSLYTAANQVKHGHSMANHHLVLQYFEGRCLA